MNSLKHITVFCFLLITAHVAFSQSTSVSSSVRDQQMGIITVPLWDGQAPNAKGSGDQDIPTLTAFLPQRGQGNGTAIIVAPGGAYRILASNLEGRQIADWFAARGVTAFVLKYRLGTNYLFPTPLIDAQRAVRWVRANHKAYGISPDRVGMMGFSAGGHLAAMAGTTGDYQGIPNAPDSLDRLSAKPDFLVLAYPWLNAMMPSEPPYIASYQKIMRIADSDAPAYEKKYTPKLLVTKDTPKTFIYSTTDDKVVSIDASTDFYTALVKAGVPAELHIFGKGQHGSGLGAKDSNLEPWPELLSQWLRSNELLTPASK